MSDYWLLEEQVTGRARSVVSRMTVPAFALGRFGEKINKIDLKDTAKNE